MISVTRSCARIAAAGIIILVGINASHAAGALAVGKCGAYGFAYDYAAFDAAKAAALRKCASGDCKVVASMKRNCAAFAIDGQNACGAFGFAAAARLGQAQNTALRQCYQHGGKDCVIRTFVCDGKG
jgi:DNA-binding MurR/RpiR family transcriptional regulator